MTTYTWTETNLASQIEDQKAPKTETGVPWDNYK